MYTQTEFRNFAIHGQGLNGLSVDKYINYITAATNIHRIENMTRSVIEERPTNFREIDVFSRLMTDRIIFLGTQVEEQIANIITAQLLFLESVDPKKDILLYVNSPGGSVYAGLGIYDTMQYIKPDVATICTGFAASMGAVILCGGAKGKRSSLEHARIMIHQPHGGVQGQAADIEISARQIIQMRQELHQIMAKHSGQRVEKVERDADRDYWMRAQEAKEYGIIDEVLTRPTA